MEPLQVKVVHPTSLLVQLPEGCKDYFINVEKAHAAKENTAQQQSWVKPVTWTPS